MQRAFDFGAAADIRAIFGRLDAACGPGLPVWRLRPADQLVRSLIGGRTRDGVSACAFLRLIRRYPSWTEAMEAPSGALHEEIAEVTHAERKARHLSLTLRQIGRERPDFDLGFLAAPPLDEAMAWLERLPGVGCKVAASVLNFSTLARPAFVVDTHVLRVLARLGIVGARADARTAQRTVMAATEGWDAEHYGRLHDLLKRLGQTACRHGRPDCPSCPLRSGCRAATRA